MKLVKQIDSNVSVYEMKDGDIAIIKNWPIPEHIGTIVQRYGVHLVALGKRCGMSWTNLFTGPTFPNKSVQILPTGTQIEI